MSINDGSAEYTLKTNASLNDISNSQNNIMNAIGYRQKNKNYALYYIAYHKSLPIGFYLECSTAGTTSNSDLTFSSLNLGTEIIDGSVTWIIKSIRHTGFYPSGDKLINQNDDLNDYIYPGTYVCRDRGTAETLSNTPYIFSNFRLNVVIINKTNNDVWGYQILIGTSSTFLGTIYIRVINQNIFSDWKAITDMPIYIDENTNIDDLNSPGKYSWWTSVPQGLPDKDLYNIVGNNDQWGTLTVEIMGYAGSGQALNPLKQTLDLNVSKHRFFRYKTGSPLKWGPWILESFHSSTNIIRGVITDKFEFKISYIDRNQTLIILTEVDMWLLKLSYISNTNIQAEIKKVSGFSSMTCNAIVKDIYAESSIYPSRMSTILGTIELTFSEQINGIKILGNFPN